MTLYLALTLGLTFGGLALGFLSFLLFDYDTAAAVLGFVLGVIAVLMVIIGLMIGIGTPAEQAYGRSQCHSYSRNTGRDTRFVITTSIDSGTCMTKDANGRWIDVNDLRAVAPQQP